MALQGLRLPLGGRGAWAAEPGAPLGLPGSPGPPCEGHFVSCPTNVSVVEPCFSVKITKWMALMPLAGAASWPCCSGGAAGAPLLALVDEAERPPPDLRSFMGDLLHAALWDEGKMLQLLICCLLLFVINYHLQVVF